VPKECIDSVWNSWKSAGHGARSITWDIDSLSITTIDEVISAEHVLCELGEGKIRGLSRLDCCGTDVHLHHSWILVRNGVISGLPSYRELGTGRNNSHWAAGRIL